MAYGQLELNAGSGGLQVAVDTIAGSEFQRVKPAFGVEGAAVDVSASNPLPVGDAGGSLTVDGTVAATQSGTWNVNNVAGTVSLPTGASTSANQTTEIAALAAIQAAVEALDNTVSGSELQIDLVGSLPAGTNGIGKLTANSGVDIGDVDVTSVTPGVAASSLGKAEDAAHTSGDVGVAALAVRRDTPAVGADTDGDYATINVDGSGRVWTHDPVSEALLTTAASPVATISATPLQRVAIFDAADAQITSFGGGTEYTEDAAAAANPVGKATILVRADAPAGVATTNGDNVAQRGTNFGAAYCQIVDSSGNFIDSFGGAGGTSSADDADFTAGTTLGTIVQGVYESSPTSVTDGDVGAIGITATREVKTSDAAAAALLTTIDADTSTINTNVATLAGAVAGTEMQVDIVSGSVTADTELPAAAALADNAANPTAPAVGAFAMCWDGAAWDRVPGTAADGLTVNLGANNDVTVTGSVTADTELPAAAALADNTANPTVPGVGAFAMCWDGANWDRLPGTSADGLTVNLGANNDVTITGTATVAGAAAHDAAISGNPVRIAGRGMTADYTAVSTGETADLLASILGKLITMPYALPANSWSYAAASGGIVNTTGVTAKAAGGSGVRNYITHVSVINGHASVDTDVQIRDGASGTVLWRQLVKAGGGGVSETFSPPLRGTADTLVEIANGTTGSATYFNLQGYVGAE